MNEIKHTPGPWVAEFYEGSEEFYKDDWEIKDASGDAFMGHTAYYPWNSSNPADVHLIAAAPEILAALKYAGELLENGGFDMSIIDAAIAKAKGE